MKPTNAKSRLSNEASANASLSPSRREKIIEAAAHCFDLYSIQRTTMDDIVKASGYSRPTIYREFSGKDEIVECVAVNASREITRAVQAAMASIDNSRERIATAILTSVVFQISNRRANEVLSGDFRVMLLRSASPGVVETVAERWTPILTAAIADGTLRGDLDLDETMSWLTDLQILLAARYLSHNETVENIKREIAVYILDGLCARP